MFAQIQTRSGKIKHLADNGEALIHAPGKNARPRLPGLAAFAGSARELSQ
jgi:hypothetical protein